MDAGQTDSPVPSGEKCLRAFVASRWSGLGPHSSVRPQSSVDMPESFIRALDPCEVLIQEESGSEVGGRRVIQQCRRASQVSEGLRPSQSAGIARCVATGGPRRQEDVPKASPVFFAFGHEKGG